MITSVGNYEKKIQDKGISGSTLKLIGIITMLIDHTAAVVKGRFMIRQALPFCAIQS